MKILSQNLANYDFPIPHDVIFRINLAWCNSIDELKSILDSHPNSTIFLDLPVGRLKPPNNKYSLDDIVPILESSRNIKYFAISNVEGSSDLTQYLDKIPQNVIIVPKIESPTAVDNIKEISDCLTTSEKVMMLDHDDLFSAILRRKENEAKFLEYIEKLTTFCKQNQVTLLRTIGVVFSDEEKRITQYIK